MRRHVLRLGLLEYLAISALLVVAAYTAWVAWDVHGSRSHGEADAARARPPQPSVQVAAPSSRATPPSLGPLRAAASAARAILVVGDSTGAGPGAWVDLVARDLGQVRRVKLHDWDETAGRFARAPTSYGDSGPRLDLWNLSYHGVAPDYPNHLAALPRPGVVLLDIGHDRSSRSARRAATVTFDAVATRWGDVPTAVVLQNPSVQDQTRQQRRAVRSLAGLAREYDDPVIDVYAAFERSAPGQTLVAADSRPTDAGSRLWADVVDGALGVATSK